MKFSAEGQRPECRGRWLAQIGSAQIGLLIGLLIGLAPTGLLLVCGCMPESKPPVVDGPLTGNRASQLQAKVRSKLGEKYSVPHQADDKMFDANWELSNSLKRSSRLQIKPPADWTRENLETAMRVVLDDHASKPWYGLIDASVMQSLGEACDAADGIARNVAPETPYDITVKVKKHSTEWFVEVRVQILDDNGMAVGF